MIYKTITGRKIELDSLTPWELGVLQNELNLVRLPRLLFFNLDNSNREISKSDRDNLPGPELFRDMWEMLLKNRIPENQIRQIKGGLLEIIIKDIEVRLGIIKYGWKKDFIQHDPRWLIRDWRQRQKYHGTLEEFAKLLAVDNGQMSRALKSIQRDVCAEEKGRGNDTHLSIPTLRLAMSKAKLAFEQVNEDAPDQPLYAITCRDYSEQLLGARMQFMSQVLRSVGFEWTQIRELAYVEFCARAGSSCEARDALFSYIENHSKVLPIGVAVSTPLENICAFEITPDVFNLREFAQKYAWIIFGLEFNWFECFGLIPLVFDSESVKVWKEKGLGLETVNQPSNRSLEQTPMKCVEHEERGAVCHYEHVDSMLWGKWKISPEYLAEVEQETGTDLKQRLANLFKSRSEILLSSEAVQCHILQVLGRWYCSFTGKTLLLSEIVREFRS